MGIYEREYVREEANRFGPADWSGVTWLIVVSAGVFLVDLLLLRGEPGEIPLLLQYFALDAARPWQVHRLFTYGFLHSTTDVMHLVFNMFGLWVFGREVERIYGRSEFLRLYLALLVAAGLAWEILALSLRQDRMLLGASGAVTGVTILFALHHPRATIYLLFVPVEAWVAALLFIAMDIFGTLRSNDTVAYSAHLAGAAAAFGYYKSGIHLARLVPAISWRMFRRRPRLRVHEGEPPERSISDEVDRILAKITRSGESSLTRAERRTLEDAARRYQRRRQ